MTRTAQILTTGSYVPERVVSNQEIDEIFSTDICNEKRQAQRNAQKDDIQIRICREGEKAHVTETDDKGMDR